MLGQSLQRVLRTSAFRVNVQEDTARKFAYENVKVHKLRYKSQARERRKALVRAR